MPPPAAPPLVAPPLVSPRLAAPALDAIALDTPALDTPGGACVSIRTPLGEMRCVASDVGVVRLEFVDPDALETPGPRSDFGVAEPPHAAGPLAPGHNRHTREAERQLAAYFAGQRPTFDVALDLRGSPFQLAVWERLGRIPFGAVASYGQIARDVGRAGAARAVGRANGENRIAIIVPCHRVIQSSGSLCGYAGGVWRKRSLLEHEARFAPASTLW